MVLSDMVVEAIHEQLAPPLSLGDKIALRLIFQLQHVYQDRPGLDAFKQTWRRHKLVSLRQQCLELCKMLDLKISIELKWHVACVN